MVFYIKRAFNVEIVKNIFWKYYLIILARFQKSSLEKVNVNL